MSKRSVKKQVVTKLTYGEGTKARAIVRVLLDSTGLTRNGRPSDYNYVRSVAQFGNQTGFVTVSQMAILGRMYNRVVGNGTRRSWKRVK